MAEEIVPLAPGTGPALLLPSAPRAAERQTHRRQDATPDGVYRQSHQAAGDLHQHFIARRMPPVVVNQFEIIAIKKQQCRGLMIDFILHQLGERVTKGGAVSQAGQRIV